MSLNEKLIYYIVSEGLSVLPGFATAAELLLIRQK